MQPYNQERPRAVPVQIGTNWTHVHVAMFVATILTCGLAAPLWAIAAIVHAVTSKRPHHTPQQFQQGRPQA